MGNKSKPVPMLYWFNQDLRLDDNPALEPAAARSRLSSTGLIGRIRVAMVSEGSRAGVYLARRV